MTAVLLERLDLLWRTTFAAYSPPHTPLPEPLHVLRPYEKPRRRTWLEIAAGMTGRGR